MKNIDTEFAVKIIKLDKNNLSCLNDLIEDFRALYLHVEMRKETFSDKTFFDLLDLDEFVNYCKYKFGENNKKDVKFSRKFNYNNYINRYRNLLKQLIDNDMFNELYLKVISQSDYVYDEYKSFIDYLCSICDKKDLVLDNLAKINELGIANFSFKPYKSFDGIHDIIVQEGENNLQDERQLYCVHGTLTDGEKSWLNQYESNVYRYVTKNANFKIEFIKGSANNDIVSMYLRNLEFNSNDLPSRDDIMNKHMLLDIDFDLIREKNWLIDFNYGAVSSLESANDLLLYSNYLLEQLNVAGSRSDYVILKNQLVMLEPFIKNLKEIQDRYLRSSCDSEVTSFSEIYNLTDEKIKYEKNREKYYGKRKK